MVDPGGIVGAISLALQVAQGLRSYMSQFTSYHDDVAVVISRIERLESILRVMERPISRLQLENCPISEEFWSCVAECLRTVQRLKKFQAKCSQPSNGSDGLKSTVQRAKDRVMYPFRIDTLQELQKTLDRVLGQLQVIVSTLELDTAAQFFDKAETWFSKTHQGMGYMKRLQCHQLELQQRMDDREAEHMQQALANQSDIDQKFEEQSLTLVNISKSQVAVESKLDALLSIMAELPVSLSISPSQVEIMASSTENRTMYLSPAADTGQNSPNKWSSASYTTKFSDTGSSFCLCRKRLRRFMATLPLSISLFLETTTYHTPQCPYYVRCQDSTAIGIQFLVGKATYMVEAAVKWGAIFIAPYITVRNVVPKNSPSFKIVSALDFFLYKQSHRAVGPTEVGSSLTLTLKSLVQLFRENRAGPSDVTASGSTVFHEICHAIPKVFNNQNLPVIPNITDVNSFIHHLNDIGVPQNERDGEGCTPLDQLLLGLITTAALDIPVLTGMESSWVGSLGQTRLIPFRFTVYHEWSTKQSLDYDVIEDPLFLHILQQTEAKLLEYLEQQNGLIRVQDELFLLHAASAWPKGVKLLLKHGVRTDTLDQTGRSALDWAIWYKNIEVVHLLLEARVPITRWTWQYALEAQNPVFAASVAREVKNRIENHPEILLSTRMHVCEETHVSQYEAICLSLYHAATLTIDVAKELFKVGFNEIDLSVSCKNLWVCGWGQRYGTPLWVHAANLNLEQFTTGIAFLKWFIDKGAMLNAVHPHFKTLPNHLIAERVVLGCIHGDIDNENDAPVSTFDEGHKPGMFLQIDSNFNNLIQKVFQSTYVDGCNCACSEGGCSVTTVIFKVSRQILNEHDRGCPWVSSRLLDLDDLSVKKLIFNAICCGSRYGFAQNHFSRQSFFRTMTFDRLGLTHTCHNHGHDLENCVPHLPMGKTEISDIQYVEREDIALLERLLGEFEFAWQNHSGSLSSFMNGYWSERMEQVLVERNPPRLGELREIGDLAFKVKQLGPDLLEPLPKAAIPEFGTWEWFQWEVERIMKDE